MLVAIICLVGFETMLGVSELVSVHITLPEKECLHL